MLQARKAVKDDWARLLNWRREAGPESFLTGIEVSVSDHVKWLDGILDSKDTQLFVVTEDATGNAVGTFRIDRKIPPTISAREDIRDGACEVSLTIGAEHRGKGYGKKVLDLAASMVFRGEDSDPRRILARVKQSNPVSMRLFVSAGYRLVEDRDGLTLMSLERPQA